MPNQWSNKDERQYQHIKDSAKERGKSEDRAKEIAARTVNKERAQEGRTQQSKDYHTEASNSGGGSSLEDRTKDELYKMAQQLHINHRSQMNKHQLVRAIQKNR